jgi:hypothetical protein
MKKSIIALIIALIAITANGQKLIDIYKKGAVRLIPDTEYAKDNNWDVVFKTYYDTLYGKPMGNRKSLKVMPDGSVVVNHAYRYFYSKFSPTGKFEKEFGIKNSKGVPLKKFNGIDGIINNNTFYTSPDNMGNMICFDFNGNYLKTLKLNYMARQIITLSNNNIAVVGWVIWEKKFRDFVAIVDYKTNKEKVIWEYYTNRCDFENHCTLFNYSYKFKIGGAISITTMPYSKDIGMSSPPQIATVLDRLIVSNPVSGEIIVYDLDGNLKSKSKIDWATNYISVEEQKKIQQEAIKRFKNKGICSGLASKEENKEASEYMIAQMEADLDKIKDPIPIPVFSTIIKDSDGNLLYFEFPKEENANKFNVWIYENNGKFVCQSSFVCDDYELQINPSKLVFHNGYIYGLQILKKASNVPLRLVRFKVSN